MSNELVQLGQGLVEKFQSRLAASEKRGKAFVDNQLALVAEAIEDLKKVLDTVAGSENFSESMVELKGRIDTIQQFLDSDSDGVPDMLQFKNKMEEDLNSGIEAVMSIASEALSKANQALSTGKVETVETESQPIVDVEPSLVDGELTERVAALEEGVAAFKSLLDGLSVGIAQFLDSLKGDEPVEGGWPVVE